MVKYTQTQLEQEEVEGLTKCTDCKKIAFTGAYCLYCGYPGKVSKRGRRKTSVEVAKKTVARGRSRTRKKRVP